MIPDIYRCMYCEECLRWAETANKTDLISVSQREPPVFRFTVEVCTPYIFLVNHSASVHRCIATRRNCEIFFV